MANAALSALSEMSPHLDGNIFVDGKVSRALNVYLVRDEEYSGGRVLSTDIDLARKDHDFIIPEGVKIKLLPTVAGGVDIHKISFNISNSSSSAPS